MQASKSLSVAKLTKNELHKTIIYSLVTNRVMSFKYPNLHYTDLYPQSILHSNPYILDKNIIDIMKLIENKKQFDYQPPWKTYNKNEYGFIIENDNYWYYNHNYWWRPLIVNDEIRPDKYVIFKDNNMDLITDPYCLNLTVYDK